MAKPLEIKGKKFNRLTAISYSHTTRSGHSWNFICDCGKRICLIKRNVLTGNTKSCGCLNKELASKREKTHGDTRTKFYSIFRGMIDRCENKNNPGYKNYGKRGIGVEWDSYEQFKQDMYGQYVKHLKTYPGRQTSIERTDNNKNYSKENCRWATRKEQARNRRSNVVLTLNGKKKILVEWCEVFGLNFDAVQSRLKNGWPVNQALTLPRYAHK